VPRNPRREKRLIATPKIWRRRSSPAIRPPPLATAPVALVVAAGGAAAPALTGSDAPFVSSVRLIRCLPFNYRFRLKVSTYLPKYARAVKRVQSIFRGANFHLSPVLF
jgi:hypothetical protein